MAKPSNARQKRRARGRRARPARRRLLRFPCGHLASQAAVNSRLREAPGAVWVACLECAVVIVAVDRSMRPAKARRPCRPAGRRG